MKLNGWMEHEAYHFDLKTTMILGSFRLRFYDVILVCKTCMLMLMLVMQENVLLQVESKIQVMLFFCFNMK